jgi:hypothetical protein
MRLASSSRAFGARRSNAGLNAFIITALLYIQIAVGTRKGFGVCRTTRLNRSPISNRAPFPGLLLIGTGQRHSRTPKYSYLARVVAANGPSNQWVVWTHS